MKKKTTKNVWGWIKFLLILPVFMLTFCKSDFEDPSLIADNKLTKDAKVLLLMKAAIQSESNENLTKNKEILSKSEMTKENDQCTYFDYPMTFEVYSGDDPIPVLEEINSDEELIAFIDLLIASATTYEFYIYFPITLLDVDGVPTVLNDLTELEGTLQMAVEACSGFDNDDDDDDDGTDDNGTDDNGSSDDGNSDDGGNDNNGTDNNASNDGDDDGNSSEGNSNEEEDQKSNNESEHIGDSEGDNNDNDKSCGKNNKKVSICHKGKTICVSVNAIWGHLNQHQEDYLGGCDD